jgi:prolyl oligopeptidase
LIIAVVLYVNGCKWFIFVSVDSDMKRVLFVALLCGFCEQEISAQSMFRYPNTRKDESVVDNYFGTKVADPYRWLENDTSAETAEWVRVQTDLTSRYLKNLPFTAKIKSDLTQLWNYPKYGTPTKHGKYYYFYKNDGLQNQSILYRQLGLDGAPEIFLDPNMLSKDGTAALGSVVFSASNKYVAYTVSKSGSDWQDIFVMDVGSKKLLKDQIGYTKFGGVSWLGDNSFYYSGYDKPSNEATKYSAKSEFQKIFLHTIGSDQGADVVIYEDKSKPLLYKGVGLTEDERFLILYLTEGTDGSELKYWDLRDKAQTTFKDLLPGYKYNYTVINNVDDKLLVYTNHGASNYQVVLVDPKATSQQNWTTVIAERSEKLDGVKHIGGILLAEYLLDATSKIVRYSAAGKQLEDFVSPGIGTISGFSGRAADEETFYTFSSFSTPPLVFRYNIAKNTNDVFVRPQTNFKVEIKVTQVKFKSKDGTTVPMFICHRSDMNIGDGPRPVLMYGYGGFNISLTPSFSVPITYFMQHGGVYVMVNLRGGSEYGEAWHAAGMLQNKQNVFDDFIGAAEYLIANNITSTQRLAISGRSNGGLLVGACMTQRPDLFKVALPGVGVLDMLRYHKFTVGWGWAVEYGSSDSADQLKYLIKYSPLHNLKRGVQYPATLITTADHDDRVVPAHSFKFASTLQSVQSGTNPVMIRIDAKAGHGAGKPVSKQIDEWADVLSFIMVHTQMKFIEE